jgi:hypothetical protein
MHQSQDGTVSAVTAFLGALSGTAKGAVIGGLLGLSLGGMFVPNSFGAAGVVIGCGVLGAFIGAFFGVALGVYLAMKRKGSENTRK